MSTILIFVEHRDNAVKKVSFELVTAAKSLGGKVAAAVVGGSTAALAAEIGKAGLDAVYTVDAPELAGYSAQGYAAAVDAVVKASGAEVVLFASTAMGKDVAPRVAAKSRAAIVTDVTELAADGGAVKVVRRTYGGKVVSTVAVKSKPAFISVRPNTFAAAAATGSAPAATAVAAPAFDIKAKVVEVKQSSGDSIDVTEANVVVAGGRGLKGPENWNLVTDLAKTLRAGQGASRAVVDAGWRPHSEQVGQTGKVVSPSLYIAAGISGAIQHLAGMQTSKVIVAVNKDAEAPIFKVADYGIVGDAFDVLPALNSELKKLLAD